MPQTSKSMSRREGKGGREETLGTVGNGAVLCLGSTVAPPT